jgi:hypothetical protein
MPSKVDIFNLACMSLKIETIQDFEEDSPSAEMARLCYEPSLLSSLAEFDWSFARTQEPLALLKDVNIEGYKYVYKVPNECVQSIKLYINEEYETQIPFETMYNRKNDTNIICTDRKNAILIYTAKIDNTTMYPSIFVEALQLKISMALLKNSKGSLQEIGAYTKLYTATITEAKSRSAITTRRKINRRNPLLEARWTGLNYNDAIFSPEQYKYWEGKPNG